MRNKLSSLEPKEVFESFENICKIPRCSGNEKVISDYLVKFAKDNNLKVIQDESLNVVIKKPGTRGYENAPTVILQGHMDMVCLKDEGIKHDFNKDAIECIVEDDFIKAKGTTLGADNGIAIAYFLAILNSKEIPHPPLEILLTTGEETGMKGASNISKQYLNLNGTLLMNLDSEMEGTLIIGCAGGITAEIKLKTNAEDMEIVKNDQSFYKIVINGLEGGHSGIEINKGRGNSNKIIGRILYDLENLVDYRILEINGGVQNNVIPKKTEAIIYIKNNNDEKIDLSGFLKKWNNILKNELSTSDPMVNLDIEKIDIHTNKVLNKKTTKKIVSLLQLIPNGIQTMSAEIEGLVESSSNLGVIKTLNRSIVFDSSIRSSVRSLKQDIMDKFKTITELMNAEVKFTDDYPEWQLKPNSKLKKICEETYIKKYGNKPELMVVHAGLECGFLKEKLGDIDMVSFGPNIYDAHTTKERLSISSAKRTWEYLLMILEKIH